MKQARVLTDAEFKRLLAVAAQMKHAGRNRLALMTRGLGATVIARKLNADSVPAFNSKDGWYQSIIKALLSRQDVIGTLQPHRMQDGKRVPDGDPIANYFPAAIDKDLFLRVQAQ